MPKTEKLTAEVFNVKGEMKSTIELPSTVFGASWNADLVHEIVTSMQENARVGTAHTKNRGEVRGGGKKPWRQKGTGRARHGSTRSPIWAGGGVAHGPRTEKAYTKKMNKNARAKALACVLSQKYRDGEIVFIDALGFTEPKTKGAKALISALGSIEGKQALATKRTNAALFLLPKRDVNAERSFQNFGNIMVSQAKDVNPVDLLTYRYVVVTEPDAALKTLEGRVASKAKKAVSQAKKAKAIAA